MTRRNNLGEDSQARGAHVAPPPELLWCRATANLNVRGNVLVRDNLYQVDPDDPIVAPLLSADPPWLLPLPGQQWGDTLQPTSTADVHDLTGNRPAD